MSQPQNTRALDHFFDQSDYLREQRLPQNPTLATLKLTGLSTYANNAAAVAGGLAVGDLYIASAGDPRSLCIVV